MDTLNGMPSIFNIYPFVGLITRQNGEQHIFLQCCFCFINEYSCVILCGGSIHIEFTELSQKTVGGGG